MSNAADELAGIMRELDAKAMSNMPERTHLATVTRVEDGITYVRLDGSQVDTPVSMLVNARQGDRVSVVIQNNVARITGNATSPPTDDKTAERALIAANAAERDAERAAEAAESAEGSASTAADAATQAQGSASQAAQSAGAAAEDAADASASATQAASDAAGAKADATRANTAANSALTQLSVVEDVAGTLSWISEHGSYVATTDTTVADGRVYFELRDGDYVPIVGPSGNPSQQGWYVLDVTDAVSDYLMAHLVVTSAGLWILPSGMGQSATPQGAPGYKLLLAPNGSYMYDDSGHLVRSDTEQGTIFDSSRPQYIGGEDAYIMYYDSDGDGSPDSILIDGENVRVGGEGKRLSEMLAEVGQASADASAALDSATLEITSTHGQLFKNGSESTVLKVAVFPAGGGRLDTIEDVRARFGASAYVEWRWMRNDGAWGTMVTTDPHISMGGMWLTVTPDDVDVKTTFEASLVLP